MSNQPVHNHDGGVHGSYERQDLSPRGIFYFLIGLSLLIVVIYFIVYGIYGFLDKVNKENQATMSPMVAPQADTRAVGPSNIQAFPEPRLEESERTELRTFIEDEDSKLATYNWVDKDKGIVQIPIERAMDLVVERGLPVRPQSQSSAAQQATQRESQQKEGSSAQ
ncbi:MAG TPA: hypothetical protein VMI10_07645 [Terriglobales bacterium]|nr:hypothetical protein [Terriglobales bacterium]